MSIDLKEVLKTGLDALQSLYDEQNGPPIIKWEDQWNEAMAKSESALKLLNRIVSEIEDDKEYSIILEYLAGKEIEYWELYNGKSQWQSYHAGCRQPRIANPAYRWRVKPKTIKYRVGFFQEEDMQWTISVTNPGDCKTYEEQPYFVKWLTDWVEAEV